MPLARASAAFIGLTLVATACGAGSSEPAQQGAPGVQSEAAPVADAPQDAPPTTDGAPDIAADPEPNGSEAPAEPDSPAAEPDSPAAEPVVVPAALRFSAPLVGGGELDVATLSGKPTIFWFWAPT